MFFSCKALAITVMMLSLASCAFREDSEDLKKAKGWQEAEESFERNKGFAAGEIKHEFIPGANPNEYSVRLSWPTGRPLLVKIETDGQLTSSHDAMTEGASVVPCKAGMMRANITAVSSKYGQMSRENIEVRCPFDYVVKNEASLDEIASQINGRLFLQNGAVLQLVRRDLNLNLIGIVVSGSAEIRTYSYMTNVDWWLPRPEVTKVPNINIKAKTI